MPEPILTETAAAEEVWRLALVSSSVPASVRDELVDYIVNRRLPAGGSFLKAVLQNNLHEAVCRGSDTEREHLAALVFWLRRHAPARSWCSPENVEEWLAQRKDRQS